MKIPKNFTNLDWLTFNSFGYEFRIEPDSSRMGDVWIFPSDKSRSIGGFKHCLFIEIDWAEKRFDVRKCLLGKGRDGEYVLNKGILKKENVLTKEIFIEKFLRDVTEQFIHSL